MSNNIVSAITLLVAMPMLLVVFLISGLFAFGKMVTIISDIWFISIIVVINILLFATKKLDVGKILMNGFLIGILFWIVGVVNTLAGINWFCGIPILGTIVCGTVALATIFTDLLGLILAGVIISGITGGILLLFKGD